MAKGGVHGERGACMVKGGVHGKGGMCGEGGHAWQRDGIHGEGGMHGKKGSMCGMPAPLYEIWPVNARAVHILLECILVSISCILQ